MLSRKRALLTSNENVFFQEFVRQDLPSSSLLLNCDRSLPLSLKKTPDGGLSQSLKIQAIPDEIMEKYILIGCNSQSQPCFFYCFVIMKVACTPLEIIRPQYFPSTRHDQLFTRNCKCDKFLIRGSNRIIDHLLTLFNLRMRHTKVNTMVRTTSDKQTSGTFQGQLKAFKD